MAHVDLRQAIQATTNKSEQFNLVPQGMYFAGDSVIAENVRHQQQKIIKFSHLAANLVMLHNVDQQTRVFADLHNEGVELTPELLGAFSPYQMAHINRLGDYTLDLDRKPAKAIDDFVLEAPTPPSG